VVRYHIKALPLREFGYQMSTAGFNLTTAPTVVPEPQGYTGVVMNDIPALRREPFMPPDLAVKPWLLLQYVDLAEAQKPEAEFWKAYAVGLYASAKPALSETSEVKQAVRELRAAGTAISPETIVGYVRQHIARTDTDTVAPICSADSHTRPPRGVYLALLVSRLESDPRAYLFLLSKDTRVRSRSPAHFSAMQYSAVSPRRNSSRPTSAADALIRSSSRLVASTSGTAAWLITCVTPSRPVT
jgi:hypothetical protein